MYVVSKWSLEERLILILGFLLPDSHSPASTLARSRFLTQTTLRLHSFSPASQLTLPLASLCLFQSYRTRDPKRPWPGSRRPFPRNYPLERTDDTLMYPTMPQLSRLCLRFGRYLRPFVHDTPCIAWKL